MPYPDTLQRLHVSCRKMNKCLSSLVGPIKQFHIASMTHTPAYCFQSYCLFPLIWIDRSCACCGAFALTVSLEGVVSCFIPGETLPPGERMRCVRLRKPRKLKRLWELRKLLDLWGLSSSYKSSKQLLGRQSLSSRADFKVGWEFQWWNFLESPPMPELPARL